MKRFLFAAVLAVGAALATTDTADAQYVYRYGSYVPGYGGAYNRGFVTPYSTGYRTNYYSPYGGYGTQSYYGNAFGGQTATYQNYNPWTNTGVNRMYTTTPGFYGPYTRNYTWFYRR